MMFVDDNDRDNDNRGKDYPLDSTFPHINLRADVSVPLQNDNSPLYKPIYQSLKSISSARRRAPRIIVV